jgi:hypothetical protein
MRGDTNSFRRGAVLAAPCLGLNLIWFVASGIYTYPHGLSYFNEAIGGPLGGPEHLLGRNVDWGQDLKYVSEQLVKHGVTGPVALNPVSLYPTLDVQSALIAFKNRWQLTSPALLVTSVNHLARVEKRPPAIRKVIRVGYSMWICRRELMQD